MMKRFLYFAWLFVSAFAVQAQQSEVSFSVPGGFYDSTFHVALSCEEVGCVIRYTTNGNAPSATSMVYSDPLLLDENLYSHSDIYTIRTCPDSLWYRPDSVKHCIIIRAAAFDAQGNCVSDVVTNSYFIRALGCDTHGLPVVSLCADSLDLFDYERGIMILGAHFDSLSPEWSGNCFQRGREWERMCNIEFYELDNVGINQQAGLRMHGGSSRAGQQKGMKIYARKEYGTNRFHHPFFKELKTSSFKHIVMKPFCHQQTSNAVLEHVCLKMACGLDVEMLASRFVVVFLNGEYWGVYDFKEKPDERFLEDHFRCDPQRVDMVESWDGKVSCGSNKDFVKMMRWFVQADLSSDENYRNACTLIDVGSFVDYYCLELYAGNVDWPCNNVRCWKVGQGKWRWMFYDGDECLNGSDNMLALALANEGKVTEYTLLFNKLLTNQEFRDRFYGRMGWLMTHEFDYKKTSVFLQESSAEVEGELQNQIARYGKPKSKAGFAQRIWYADHFLKYRTLNVSSALYRFYYHNGWQFNLSKKASQKRFKLNPERHNPTFLFRMARQFKEWQYVELYFEYERYHFKELVKSSWVWQRLKS